MLSTSLTSSRNHESHLDCVCPPRWSGLAALAQDTDKPKDILELKPDLNQKIAAAIMKCISADADDRFGTIPEFLTAIQDCQHENENG